MFKLRHTKEIMAAILLIIPPLTQINTPYPSTAYLAGFLSSKGYEVAQADLGLEMILTLFSKSGFQEIFDAIAQKGIENLSLNAQRIFALQTHYIETIDSVILFLQGKDDTLSYAISNEHFLPQASRFDQMENLEGAFGTMGIRDKARYMATMYLEDMGDLIVEAISPHFGFSRYAERISMSATSFDPIIENLNHPHTLLETALLKNLSNHIIKHQPKVVGLTVPFPGNLFGALKCGQYLKTHHPTIKVIMGGGYVNTELRSLNDPRIFDYIDFLTFDDGEGPLLNLLSNIFDKKEGPLKRTMRKKDQAVLLEDDCTKPDFRHSEIGTPDYAGLPFDKYLSILEMANPMHRLWSDGRWNKITVAHGCYWKRCSFCDISLDYIGRYETAPAKILVDRIEAIIEQTGETGFHFVDEAAPPLAMRDLAVELIRRGVKISWWTNIRFEKTFTADLCRLLSTSGCVAVSGGLEVASDRLLALMEKGVSVKQVAQVAQYFTESGIMVHAYLMYGFPTQTAQETIDSLEVVRQLFDLELIQSGFWHRFSMTAHSPVGLNPEKYKVKALGPIHEGFAWNDLIHDDPTGADHDRFTEGLNKALYNFMHGFGLDEPLDFWFDFEIDSTQHDPQLIEQGLTDPFKTDWDRLSYVVYWTGGKVNTHYIEEEGITQLMCFTKTEEFELNTDKATAQWLTYFLDSVQITNGARTTLQMIKEDFEEKLSEPFEWFVKSEPWLILRRLGLLLIRY